VNYDHCFSPSCEIPSIPPVVASFEFSRHAFTTALCIKSCFGLSLLQAMINYLQTRPWAEVNGMLMEIQRIVALIDTPGPFPATDVNGERDELLPVRKN
jgi:hypothetical protein